MSLVNEAPCSIGSNVHKCGLLISKEGSAADRAGPSDLGSSHNINAPGSCEHGPEPKRLGGAITTG